MRFAVVAISIAVLGGFLAAVVLTFLSVPPTVTDFSNVSSCMVIDTPGAWKLNTDLTGALDDDIGPFEGACILIDASDVVLDCDGHSITRDGDIGPKTVGILAYDNSDITIMNCPGVSGYRYGVVLEEVEKGSIYEVTAHDNVAGFVFENTDGLKLEGLVSHDNTVGFDFVSASDGYITDSKAYSNTADGFELAIGGISSLDFLNNEASDNGENGFGGSAGEGNDVLLFKNTAANNGGDGISLINTGGVELVENELIENEGYGICVVNSVKVIQENNVASSNAEGDFC